jgi:hypothetical protein
LSWFFHYYGKRKQEKKFLSSPSYQEWKKTVAEMGLIDFSDTSNQDPLEIVGDYRNHHIKISEVEYTEEDHGESSGSTIRSITYYDVEFENLQKIMLSIKNRSFFSFLSRSKNNKMSDPTFDEKFSVKGNNEEKIRAILDPSIRSKIMEIQDFSIVIGVDKITEYVRFQKPTVDSAQLIVALRMQLMSQIKKGLESRYNTNVAEHVDSQSLIRIKHDVNRFRAIIDIMIDIVEKIEVSPV